MARIKTAAARRTRPARAALRKASPSRAVAPRVVKPATAKPALRTGPMRDAKPKAARRPDPAVAAAAAGVVAVAAESATNELRYLQARRIEDLAQAFVSLTSELWIVKDRLAVLEQVLDRHGIPAPSAVDAFTPDGEFKSSLDAERRAWAQRMIAALFPRGLPKVD
jgi:hypothetical protein